MAQLTLEIPDTLHHQLEGLAQREGVQLRQYILYMLTHQVASAYTVQVMPAEAIAQQEAAYLALRQQWGPTLPRHRRHRSRKFWPNGQWLIQSQR